MIETATTNRQRKAFDAAHAARGAALRDGLRWILSQFHVPLRFEGVRTLTAPSR
ncbi:hypothetical protein [Cognatishimia sp.]|uniref:hypothetical protein n=1 Tax=Cognatishimia sp. TaxID=2211648 RepID=UPI0035169391